MTGIATIEAKSVHNMPLPDRRSFLRRAATALTAIVATRPAPAAALVQEDPAIIALGERIEPLLVAYRNAAEERLQARTAAEASCPAVPEELLIQGTFLAGCTVSECDVEGGEILHDVFSMDGTKSAANSQFRGNESRYCSGDPPLRSAIAVWQKAREADRDR